MLEQLGDWERRTNEINTLGCFIVIAVSLSEIGTGALFGLPQSALLNETERFGTGELQHFWLEKARVQSAPCLTISNFISFFLIIYDIIAINVERGFGGG